MDPNWLKGKKNLIVFMCFSYLDVEIFTSYFINTALFTHSVNVYVWKGRPLWVSGVMEVDPAHPDVVLDLSIFSSFFHSSDVVINKMYVSYKGSDRETCRLRLALSYWYIILLPHVFII